MSAADDALATVRGLDSLLLAGETMRSDISSVLQQANVSRTIEGASTLTLELYDDAQRLLKSGVFSELLSAQLDSFRFELVQVRKTGSGLTVVFEDLPVAALRRHSAPLKISANTTTHVDFAERLVREEPWLKFWVPEQHRSAERVKVELARGEPAATGTQEKREDTWTALGRIADERGWRRYIVGSETIAYVPETYLLEQESSYTFRENTNGVENIDFDFDSGKPVASVTLTVRAAQWAVPVGTAVTIEDLGPVNGKWLVSSISRSIFSLYMVIVLKKARPVLPEPEETSAGSSSASSSSSSPGGSPPAVGPTGKPIQPSAAGTWPDDPKNLVSVGQGTHRLAAPAAESFRKVEASFGRQIKISDSYRSVSSQAASYRANPERFGRPTSSAHTEGRAVDVDLRAVGANPQGEPTNWLKDQNYRRLVEAFSAHGWCNYQLKNGSANGRTREPWHFSYRVCK